MREPEHLPRRRGHIRVRRQVQPYPAGIALVRQLRMIDFDHGRIPDPVRRSRRRLRAAAPHRPDYRNPGIGQQGRAASEASSPSARSTPRRATASRGGRGVRGGVQPPADLPAPRPPLIAHPLPAPHRNADGLSRACGHANTGMPASGAGPRAAPRNAAPPSRRRPAPVPIGPQPGHRVPHRRRHLRRRRPLQQHRHHHVDLTRPGQQFGRRRVHGAEQAPRGVMSTGLPALP